MGLTAAFGRHSDTDVVERLQRGDRRMEERFYRHCKKYFDDHFLEVFFDKDRKQEIFQTAFLKLWTEIENRKIRIVGEKICRQQSSGEYIAMTCSLTTFLMVFAKNDYREMVRSNRLDTYADVYEKMTEPMEQDDMDALEVKHRIIDECIERISPRCVEIITLFYYKGKSLDEIMELRQDKNTSKNGLKTAKNKCMNTLRGLAEERLRMAEL